MSESIPLDPAGRPAAAAADAAALPSGHTVFEYRIEKMLGGGGFGITYLARDINLEQSVAIKEYFPGDLTARAADLSARVRTPEAEQQFHWGRERFLGEARALASFCHPNIARLLRYLGAVMYWMSTGGTGFPRARRQHATGDGAGRHRRFQCRPAACH
jgi:serine/threonine protein kinase